MRGLLQGQYMCQINTARAKTRLGNLHVVGIQKQLQFLKLKLCTYRWLFNFGISVM